jgi:hypothetical protein
MPSMAQMRDTIGATRPLASRDSRCHVTVLMNLPTHNPPV